MAADLIDNMGMAREVAMLPETTVASGDEGTAYGDAVSGLAGYHRALFLLDVTAVDDDVDDTLDVFIDVSPDNGTTWINAIHFTQVLGNGAPIQLWAALDATGPGTSVVNVTSDAASAAVRPQLWGSQFRVRHVTAEGGGADMAFTFSVTGLFQR